MKALSLQPPHRSVVQDFRITAAIPVEFDGIGANALPSQFWRQTGPQRLLFSKSYLHPTAPFAVNVQPGGEL